MDSPFIIGLVHNMALIRNNGILLGIAYFRPVFLGISLTSELEKSEVLLVPKRGTVG